MKTRLIIILTFIIGSFGFAQPTITLKDLINAAKSKAPALHQNETLLKIGEIQEEIIQAENSALHVNVSSDVMFAPFFNNNGNPIDITTNPSPEAFGYDIGITNGGLYSAQLNITKNLFNQSVTDNLVFQNKIKNSAIALSSEEIEHNLIKSITDAYIAAYQLQIQEELAEEIISDLEKRLQVVEILVKKAVLMESDYLLLQLDIESKKLELKQTQSNLKTAITLLYSLSGLSYDTVEQLQLPIIGDTTIPPEFFYQRKFENDSLQIVADLDVFNNQYKPQITAYANTGLNAVELNNIYRKIGASAGLRLVIPLYDGHQKEYNEQQSKLQANDLVFSRENNKTILNNNLNAIKQQIDALDRSMKLMDEQLVKQQNIMEIYKGKLVQGQVSIVDYLNIIQNYKINVYTRLQMQTNRLLLESQYNYTNW